MSTYYYDDPKIIKYFNMILNGRWHTGLAPHRYGQIEMEELVIKSLKIIENDKVLDFGSGCGLTTCDIHLMTKCQIIGLNISPKQVEMSNELRDNIGISKNNVEFILSKTAKLPFANSSFDKIIFFESICHVDDKVGLLNEFYRILKPNGLIGGEDWIQIGSTPNLQDQYITPVLETYAIPSLWKLSEWDQNLKYCNFKQISTKDLKLQYNIKASFQTDYFSTCSCVELLIYIIKYIISYILVKYKYPKLLCKYPNQPTICDEKLFTKSAEVLHDAYNKQLFTVGLIIAQK